MSETLLVGENDIGKVAEKVVSSLEERVFGRARIIHLEGDLGAGKTTFTKELAKALGVKERVTSPTFILKKEYKTEKSLIKKLVHIDAYRFENKEEGKVLAIEDDQNPDTLIVIEWPEKMHSPAPDVHILFEYKNEDLREVTITNYAN